MPNHCDRARGCTVLCVILSLSIVKYLIAYISNKIRGGISMFHWRIPALIRQCLLRVSYSLTGQIHMHEYKLQPSINCSMVGAAKPAPRYLQAEQWGLRCNDDPCVMTNPKLSCACLKTTCGDEQYLRGRRTCGYGAG